MQPTKRATRASKGVRGYAPSGKFENYIVWDCISCVLKPLSHEYWQPKANQKTWILIKQGNFKMDLFGAESTLYTYFTVFENITI